MSDNVLHPPESGWGGLTFVVVGSVKEQESGEREGIRGPRGMGERHNGRIGSFILLFMKVMW